MAPAQLGDINDEIKSMSGSAGVSARDKLYYRRHCEILQGFDKEYRKISVPQSRRRCSKS